jgi:hypothetical protein
MGAPFRSFSFCSPLVRGRDSCQRPEPVSNRTHYENDATTTLLLAATFTLKRQDVGIQIRIQGQGTERLGRGRDS